ncbi:MAG: beta-ketoacyl-[acyl-carrier-protein] synthase family protein [Bdellovibrionales bacterium]|nr:beta-ketoacyl-[acyl-carrier-protein] synthase family protein [Bdellovibrionales bacterium]
MRRRVVVTGLGLTSPLGNDLETFGTRMFAGESGVRDIRGTIAAKNFPVPYAAPVDTDALSVPEVMRGLPPASLSRYWTMAVVATEQALHNTPATLPIDALIYGTAEALAIELVTETAEMLRRTKSLNGFDWKNAQTEASLLFINEMLVQRGFKSLEPRHLIAINSACASGNQAIGVAVQRIRSGEWERCLAGGVDARSNVVSLMNFHMLGAVTTADLPAAEASRPFAADRSGFVRGEGSATLLLESLDAALARGAPIYGEIAGFANTCDAYRLTDGREDGVSVVRAMRGAIEDAQLTPTDIDYINAHGTSTPLNDRLETFAIKQLFGERAYQIPVSSLKSQIGHSTVAAGAVEAVACLLMLREQKLAPTINYHAKDPECDLDYVPNVTRPARVRTILSNNFGFGGQNSCLVLKEYRA